MIAELERVIEREARLRADPKRHAERIVAAWTGLEAEHRELWREQDQKTRERVEERLQGLTREIKADPVLETEVRERYAQLERSRGRRLGAVIEERDLHRALALSLGRGREQDHDQGLSL